MGIRGPLIANAAVHQNHILHHVPGHIRSDTMVANMHLHWRHLHSPLLHSHLHLPLRLLNLSTPPILGLLQHVRRRAARR